MSPGVRALPWVRSTAVLVLGVAASALAGGEGPVVSAGEDCARAAASRVQGRYEGVRDLSARFEQRTETVALGSHRAQALEAAGEVVFAKPGRMRWSYDRPEPSLVVSDGRSVWIFDPQAREAQHLPLGESFLSGAAIQFLLGEGELLQEFEVRAEGCGSDEVRLRLVPRQEAPYEHIVIRVEPASGEVRETEITDLLGNVTRVRLLEPRVNTSPEAGLFQFSPPEGVRVMEVPAR